MYSSYTFIKGRCVCFLPFVDILCVKYANHAVLWSCVEVATWYTQSLMSVRACMQIIPWSACWLVSSSFKVVTQTAPDTAELHPYVYPWQHVRCTPLVTSRPFVNIDFIWAVHLLLAPAKNIFCSFTNTVPPFHLSVHPSLKCRWCVLPSNRGCEDSLITMKEAFTSMLTLWLRQWASVQPNPLISLQSASLGNCWWALLSPPATRPMAVPLRAG